MENENNENLNAGGTGEANAADKGSGGSGNKDEATVKYEQAIADLKKYKTSHNALEGTINQLKEELESHKNRGADGTQDFKKLYEESERKRAEEKDARVKLHSSIVFNEKYNAVQGELLKRGLKPEGLKVLSREELDEIEVEGTTKGNFIVHGADLYADKFAKEYPSLFTTKPNPRINGGLGGGNKDASFDNEGPVTVAKMLEAEKLWKSGKMPKSDYDAVCSKYLEQKRKS